MTQRFDRPKGNPDSACRDGDDEQVIALPPSSKSMPADEPIDWLEHDTDEFRLSDAILIVEQSGPREERDIWSELPAPEHQPAHFGAPRARKAPRGGHDSFAPNPDTFDFQPIPDLSPELAIEPASMVHFEAASELAPDLLFEPASEPPPLLPDDFLTEVDDDGQAPTFLPESALFEIEPTVTRSIPGSPALLWPNNVPSLPDAAAALFGQIELAGPMQVVTDRLRATLSPLELATLEYGDLPFLETMIRAAVLVRWRLQLALELRPAPDTPVDAVALTQLLGEVDRVLMRLNGAEVEPGSKIALVLQTARAAIVTDSVEATEIGARAPQKAKSNRPKDGRTSSGTMTVELPPRARQRFQRAAISALFVFALVGSALFHLGRFNSARTLSPRSIPTETGLSDGMITARDKATDITVLRPLGDAKIDSSSMGRLRAEASAAGKTVVETGTGELIVLPRGFGQEAPKTAAVRPGGRR